MGYIKHHEIDPVMIHLGPLSVHWYGFMYLLSFILCYKLAKYYSRRQNAIMNPLEVEKYFASGCLFLIVGGRLGYVFFYAFKQWLHDPLYLFRIWEGGMSFHGGLLGVIIYSVYFARRHNKSVLGLTDFLAPLAPIGLAFGRLGNFINGELWGRVAPEFKYSFLFPGSYAQDLAYTLKHPQFKPLLEQYGVLPRYPSQLYELFMEGVVLFVVIYFISRKKSNPGLASGSFLFLYSLFRISGEFFREPDSQFTGDWVNVISMGQLLSVPMLLVGLYMIFAQNQQNNLFKRKVIK